MFGKSKYLQLFVVFRYLAYANNEGGKTRVEDKQASKL
jgi:hypothetical protein